VSPEWQKQVGKGTSVNWPVGLGGKGNEGVSGLVKQTRNSIGYVELIYAKQNNIDYGSVKNAAGNFIAADVDSVSAAAATAGCCLPGRCASRCRRARHRAASCSTTRSAEPHD
jgi:ABC-type phosphate transport system substrate-binding protein